MSENTYEGWTNRETWLVNLWLTNEEGLYRDACEAAGIMSGADLDDWLSDYVRVNFAENAHPWLGGLVGDLLGAALNRVDWREIGEAFTEAAEEVSA